MYIDLSVSLNEQTPVYPGDPKPTITPAGVVERDGYSDHVISVGTHVGTHIDAPAHMIPGGKTLGQYPIDRFVGRGVLIRVENEYNLQTVQAANIQAGDIVLFRTGFDQFYHDSKYYEAFPAMPEAVAHYLVEHKVSIVGIDASGPDYDPFPAHKILLGGDVLIIENLTNLDKLTGDFEVIALPLKLDVDGAPTRVIAKQ